jgi:hypothetical protein
MQFRSSNKQKKVVRKFKKKPYVSKDIPAPTFDGNVQHLITKTKKIPLNYSGTLEKLLQDKSMSEFEVVIDESKRAVSISKIEFGFCCNTTPFTFIVECVGNTFLNKTIFYDKNTQSKMKTHKCMTYIPAKVPKYNAKKELLFDLNTDIIRNKIDNFDIIKTVKLEAQKYYNDYNKKIPYGMPQNYEEYMNHIIHIANLIDIDTVKKKVKVHIGDDGEEFEISPQKHKNYFDFINMTYTEDKLFMDKKWVNADAKGRMNTHQVHPVEVYNESMKLIKNIKNAIGIFKKLKFNIKPIVTVDDMETFEKKFIFFCLKDPKSHPNLLVYDPCVYMF